MRRGAIPLLIASTVELAAPAKKRKWVVLVDGNRDQLRLVKKAARRVGVAITIVVDLIHVLECLWKAAYAFHPDGSKEADSWVQQRLMWLLRGEHAKVRAKLRRNANACKLAAGELTPVRNCLTASRADSESPGPKLPLRAGVFEAHGV